MNEVESTEKNLSVLEKIDEILLKCDELQTQINKFDIWFALETSLDQPLLSVKASSRFSQSYPDKTAYFPCINYIQAEGQEEYLIELMKQLNYIELDNHKSPSNGSIKEFVSEYRFLENQQLQHSKNFYKLFQLLPNGYKRIAELSKSTDSKQVFVAMWFDPSVNKAFETIKSVVESDEFGLHTYRVDKDPHNENIVFQIIGQIKKSKFLIADFTGNRGGVYWEAGFAKGLGKPVIHCVREDCFDSKDDETKKVHFNLKQFNLIIWKDEDDLREKLIDRIRAID